MPRTTCSVPGCCRRGGYSFPQNNELRKAWLDAIQRSNWLPKDNSTVCKEHFTAKDVIMEGGLPTEKLKKTAVPSSFWWTGGTTSKEKVGGSNKIVVSPGKRTPVTKKKATGVVMGSEGEDDEEFDEDEFEDAGAMPIDSDEEYRVEGEEEEQVEEDDEEEEVEVAAPAPVEKGRGKRKKFTPQKNAQKTKTAISKSNTGKKRKAPEEPEEEDSDDNSKRPRVHSLPEYSRQLNKAYKEVSRLSSRCQLLDAALKNKTFVAHRARTVYQIGKYVLPHQLSFIEAQAINSTLPHSMRRWSRRMRNISLGLHRHSRFAYAFMAKIFAMPTEAELIKWGAQSEGATTGGGPEGADVACNNVSLVEAEALVDEVTFDNLMSVVL